MPLSTIEYQEFMKTVHQIRDVYVTMESEVKRLGQESGEMKEQNTRLEAIIQRYEAKMEQPPIPTKEDKDEESKEQTRVFIKALRHGLKALPDTEQKMIRRADLNEAPPIDVKAFPSNALVSAEDTAGGLFAPPEFVADIIKGYIQYSPMRNYARIRQTANRSIQQPKRTGTITAQWVGEKTERTVLTGYTLGRIEIPTQEMYALVLISEIDLEDVNFDLETEIRNEFSEQFGVAEGKAYILGNATLQPQGFLTHPDVIASYVVNSGTSGVIVPDTLITCLYNLPDIYASQAVWAMRRSTVAAVRKLKYPAGEQSYIWQPGIAGASPNTILGVPYVEMPDMPAVGAGANAIVLADFARAYTIVQRTGMSFKRLAERWVEDSMIGIYARMRVGGQVTLPEAMRVYQLT